MCVHREYQYMYLFSNRNLAFIFKLLSPLVFFKKTAGEAVQILIRSGPFIRCKFQESFIQFNSWIYPIKLIS
jgi:hypothetical protein